MGCFHPPHNLCWFLHNNKLFPREAWNTRKEIKIKVAAFNGSTRKDDNTAPKRVLIKKIVIKLMTIANKLFKVRSEKLPIICIFGHDDFELVTPIWADYEEKRLDCRCYSSDSNLEQVLIKDRPHVIITIGHPSSFPNLEDDLPREDEV